MAKNIRALLFMTLLLSACSSAAFSSEAAPSTTASETPTLLPVEVSITASSPTEVIPISTTEVVPSPKIIVTLSTPHIDQGPGGAVTVPPYNSQNCGYQWAQQALPELSDQFVQAMQALQPNAQAYAFGFGENCVHADGTSTFLPMETDFNVTIPVNDLSDETALGEWIVKVMQVIQNIPPDQIIGPRPGRVGILFKSNGQQQQGVTFYIDQYQALASGLSPAVIYQTLKSSQ
jgi:hypothetical protein